MRILLRGMVWLAVAGAVVMPARAATPSEFYLGTLKRGVAAYDAGRFESAIASLRIAAFGSVDSIAQYQTAELYLALAYDRMGNADAARDAAHKVVQAERIERKYGSLGIPAATRTTFETLAKKALTASDLTMLGGAAPPQQQTQTQSVATPVRTAGDSQPSKAAAEPPQSKAAAEPPLVDPKPAVVVQQPANTSTTTQQPKANPAPSKPVTEQPKTATQQTKPAQTTTTPKAPAAPTPAPVNLSARFTEADRALAASRLNDARAIYRELLAQNSLQRADLLRLAEGFYRSRDFANALRAFERLGALRRGEEPYRYYIAVALYETGQYERARQELAAVLPYIEVTPDVERYRTKIEGAIN